MGTYPHLVRSNYGQWQSQRERTDAPPCLFVAAGLFRIVGAESRGEALFWPMFFGVVFGLPPLLALSHCSTRNQTLAQPPTIERDLPDYHFYDQICR